jgi:plasmid maintenance system antidote protein VapI
MVTISDKINYLLAQRGLLKRDLAQALHVSPQTSTDICKGRSAVTVPHLRRLIEFFGLRADYWLDEQRLAPTAADETIPDFAAKIQDLTTTGLLHTPDPAGVFERMRRLVLEQRQTYLERFGEAGPEERDLLGLPGAESGKVGRIAEV